MQFVPGFNPIISRVDILQDFLSRNVIIPEVDLVGFGLKFFELRLLLVEVKDTPSAKRVASSVQPVFPSALQT
jgi:hypothetical protein